MDHTAPQPVPKKIGAAATSWKAPLAMRQILEEVLDPEARGKFPMKPTKLGNTTAKMGMRPMVLEDENSGRSGPGHPRVKGLCLRYTSNCRFFLFRAAISLLVVGIFILEVQCSICWTCNEISQILFFQNG